MRHWIAVPIGTLILGLSSCYKPFGRAETEDRRKDPPRSQAVAADGELLPPPTDVALRPVVQGKEVKDPVKHGGDKKGDDTLPLILKIIEQQDKMDTRLTKQETRGDFLPIAEDHAHRLGEVEKKVPVLETKVSNSGDQLNLTTARLEKRIADLESALHQTPLNPQPTPTPPTPDPIGGTKQDHSAEPVPTLNDEGTVTQTLDIKGSNNSRAKTGGSEIVDISSPPLPTGRDLPRDKHSDNGEKSAHPGELATGKFADKARAPRVFSTSQRDAREQVKKTYQDVIKKYPTLPAAMDAYQGLATLAEEESDWTTAIEKYKELQAKFPNAINVPQLLYNLAQAQEQAGLYEDARKNYVSIFTKNHKHEYAERAKIFEADCFLKSGRRAEALSAYRAIEREQSNNTYGQQARLKDADMLIEDKQYEEAITRLKSALAGVTQENKGDIPEIELKIAQAQGKLGQYPQLRDTLATMLARTVKDKLRYEAYLEIAKSREADGTPLESARVYSTIAADFPQYEFANQARLIAAQNYLEAELPNTAVVQCEKLLNALSMASNKERAELEPQALYTMAQALRKDNNVERSNAQLSLLQKKYPADELSFKVDFERAQMLAQAGKTEEALSALRTLQKAHPNTPQASLALLEIARLEERAGETTRGIDVYADVIKTLPNDRQSAQYRLHRALLLDEAGRSPEATPVLETLVQDTQTPEPVKVSSIYALATIEQRAGHLAGAMAQYEKLLEWAKKNPTVAASKDLKPMLDDSKWKVSKLRWLLSLQTESDVTHQP